MQELSHTIQQQEQKIENMDSSLERGQQSDPYIEMKTKQERMPYHNQNFYRPLTEIHQTRYV